MFLREALLRSVLIAGLVLICGASSAQDKSVFNGKLFSISSQGSLRPETASHKKSQVNYDQSFQQNAAEKNKIKQQRFAYELRLKNIYRTHSLRNPRSCESVYYGLFTDGVKLHDYSWNDDLNFVEDAVLNNGRISSQEFMFLRRRIEQRVEQIRRGPPQTVVDIFVATQKIFNEVLEEDKHFKNLKVLRSKYKKGSQSTELDTTSYLGIGAFMDVFTNGHPTLILGAGRLAQVGSSAAHAFTMGHEFAHISATVPQSLGACLSDKRSLGIRIGTAQQNENFGMGSIQTRQGFGTNTTNDMMDLVENGQLKLARDYLIKNNDHLPPQGQEAVADYIGIKTATRLIKKYYPTPEAQREAALGILFMWKPLAWSGEAEKLINQAGSKMSNDQRVLRGLLANKEFRDVLGCEFEKVAPLDCSDYDVFDQKPPWDYPASKKAFGIE